MNAALDNHCRPALVPTPSTVNQNARTVAEAEAKAPQSRLRNRYPCLYRCTSLRQAILDDRVRSRVPETGYPNETRSFSALCYRSSTTTFRFYCVTQSGVETATPNPNLNIIARCNGDQAPVGQELDRYRVPKEHALVSRERPDTNGGVTRSGCNASRVRGHVHRIHWAGKASPPLTMYPPSANNATEYMLSRSLNLIVRASISSWRHCGSREKGCSVIVSVSSLVYP